MALVDRVGAPAVADPRLVRALLVATIAYAVVVAACALIPARPLGHDEAVYALGARALVDDGGAAMPLHRSIGMAIVAAPGVVAGGGELALRLPVALLALGYLALIGAIARRHFGAAAAALAMAVQATNPEFTWRSAEVLSDVPSALCLLGLLAALVSPRPRWYLAGPAAAAACYVRYASAPVVAVIFAAAWLLLPSARRAAVQAAICAALLLVPFLVWSHVTTGSTLGVLREGERRAGRAYAGQGLVFYLRAWPLRLAGPGVGVVAALGLIVGLAAWRRPLDHAARVRRVLLVAALGQLALLGWRVHGEARFVTFALTALVLVGASWLAASAPRWRIAVAVTACLAVPMAAWTLIRLRDLTASRAPAVAAARAIAHDRGADPCVVYATEAPMVAWYSGCRAVPVDGWGVIPGAAAGAPQVYLLDATGLRFPLPAARAEATFGWRVVPIARRDAQLWRATTAASAAR
ncbi:MAG: glycosyltransferase family 39 protein [Myxococcales bacterium]|nr:glycosyltransferase family 39 protein [Myxococcales bacterium]